MFSRPTTPGLLALALSAGLTVAHAQGSPITGTAVRAQPIALDLTLHFSQPAQLASPGGRADGDAPVDLPGSATPPASGPGEHRLAPHVELLAGYDPYTLFDALDFKPRLGVYALGLKLDF